MYRHGGVAKHIRATAAPGTDMTGRFEEIHSRIDFTRKRGEGGTCPSLRDGMENS
jgi:hypothetical protein